MSCTTTLVTSSAATAAAVSEASARSGRHATDLTSQVGGARQPHERVEVLLAAAEAVAALFAPLALVVGRAVHDVLLVQADAVGDAAPVVVAVALLALGALFRLAAQRQRWRLRAGLLRRLLPGVAKVLETRVVIEEVVGLAVLVLQTRRVGLGVVQVALAESQVVEQEDDDTRRVHKAVVVIHVDTLDRDTI